MRYNEEKALEQLKIIYNELLNNVESMKSYIEKELYVEMSSLMRERQIIVNNLRAFRRSYTKPLPAEFYKLGTEILKKEKENIAVFENIRDDIMKELKKTRKQEAFLNAYSGMINETGKLIDSQE